MTNHNKIILITILVCIPFTVFAAWFFSIRHSPRGPSGQAQQNSSNSPSASTSPSAQATQGSNYEPGSIQSSPNSNTTVFLLKNMTLTFDEEFNTFNRYINAKGEVTCNPGGAGIWQTVYSFCSRTQFGNQEAEIYIDPGFLAFLKNESATSSEIDSDNPFQINGGILSISAKPSSTQIQTAAGSWAQYTSGLITTQYSFSQNYGYFEMRTKLPQGQGLWPAFWLLPTDKSWPPEIDVMEAFGGPNSKGEGSITSVHYASHALQQSESCGSWFDLHTDLTQDFHTYGADVEPTGITYYFDGKAYASCRANSAIKGKPLYMLINLAVGGPGSWPGTPNSSTMWPAHLYVDYVRAYANK